ncbi:DNA damage-inducible protein D [Patescibacteria group bacterium]|nr:MAG: DNA damage-inducible protein D [Patescibacteria group bacterium]
MKNSQLNALQVMGPSRDFESIKKIDENGVEYWTARDLYPVLGYAKWQFFGNVIKKAKQACVNSRQFPQDHFTDISKMTTLGHGIVRKLDDYKLSRFACYLVAQNGDPSKPAIAMAQTYFAIQTRKQEIFDGLSEVERRIAMRDGFAAENSSLFAAAKAAGVSKFGTFDDAGYQGLYNMPLSEVEKRKGIKKGELIDRADSEELGANMFRITQTEAKLKREGITGDIQAQSTHFKVGARIRQTMKELGSEMPENLKPERHIRQLKREVKALAIPKGRRIKTR